MKMTKAMRGVSGWRAVGRLLGGLALGLSTPWAAAVNDLPGGPAVKQLDFDPAATVISQQQHDLHYTMLWICGAIFVVVFGVMFYSIFKHRKSVGHQAANFHESVGVEIAWTVVPFIIVVFMGAMATKTVVAMKDTSNSDLTIKVTGYQWKWGYDYLDGAGQGIHFLSTLDQAQRQMSDAGKPEGDDYLLKVDNPLVVPVNKKVRIITTADDVIHSFAVPSFGIKQDAIPGFVRDTWFRAEKTGTFYGQCSELCGKEHAYMPITVKVVSEEEYAQWVERKQKELAALADDPNKKWELAELVARGSQVFAANCVACHGAQGQGGVGKKLDGSAIVNGPQAAQMDILLHGKNVMPSWASLSDTELAAVMTFTRNQWSNKTGEAIQPAAFKAARGGTYPTGGGSSAAAPASAPTADAGATAPRATQHVASSGAAEAQHASRVEMALAR